MTGLGALLLPIIVSAILVFIVSSIVHMGPFWHRTDFPRLPEEDQFRTALRGVSMPPGDYMVPRVRTMAEMKTPEWEEKIRQGPNVIMTVIPGTAFGMGRSLALWFVYCLVVSIFAAYVAGAALPPGAEYLPVFRFAGVAAFLAYAVALWQMSIWYHRSWGMTAKTTVDGLIYALTTAGVFGWLWPS